MCGVQLKDRTRSMVGAKCGVQLKDRKIHGGSNVWSTAQRQKDPLWEQCVEFSSKTERDLWWEQSVECSSKTERSMVGAMCGVQLKDRKIHCGNNVWSLAQRQKDIYGGNKVWSAAQRQKDPWWEQCVEFSSKTERSIVGVM